MPRRCLYVGLLLAACEALSIPRGRTSVRLRASEEGAKPTEATEEPAESTEEAPAIDENKFDMGTMSARRRVANTRAPPPSEFLNEAWKEREDSSQFSGNLAIGALGALVVALAVFASLSQVPVGNDVPSFTYEASNKRVMTPAEIAAKYKDFAPPEDAEGQ